MLQGPGWTHPLGTDDLGQDLLARMLYGGRISLSVGLAAMFVSVTVGTLVGATAGMSRGVIDNASGVADRPVPVVAADADPAGDDLSVPQRPDAACSAPRSECSS